MSSYDVDRHKTERVYQQNNNQTWSSKVIKNNLPQLCFLSSSVTFWARSALLQRHSGKQVRLHDERGYHRRRDHSSNKLLRKKEPKRYYGPACSPLLLVNISRVILANLFWKDKRKRGNCLLWHIFSRGYDILPRQVDEGHNFIP